MKKGFTIYEMMAVLLVISVMILLVLPSLVEQSYTNERIIDQVTKLILQEGTYLYIDYNRRDFNDEDFCIQVKKLYDSGMLEGPLFFSSGLIISEDFYVEGSFNGMVVKDLQVKRHCK